MKGLSLIIPSFNSVKTIESALDGIEMLDKRDVISEVIVVDSSDDGKTRMLLSRHSKDGLRVLCPGTRLMPALGRNIGACTAKGDVFLFMDSDVRPTRDWLQGILKSMEQGCMVGGGSVSLPGSQKRKLIPIAQFYLQFNEYMNDGPKRIKPFLPSCNLFCDRALFEKVGGFPLLRTAEDVMFCLAVSRHAPVWFIPEAEVHHEFREDIKGFLKNQLVLGKGIILYRRQEYHEKFYYKGIWPLIFLPGFMLIKLLKMSSRTIRSGPGHAARFLIALPLILLGLLFWGIGFAMGASTQPIRQEGIENGK